MVRAIEVNGGNKFTILWIYLTHWNCCCGITIPWTEEPGRLQSTGLQRVGHNWATEWIHFHFSLSSLSYAWPCATPWTAACKAFLSSTISWSLLKFMSIESEILSNHLILCHPFSSCPQSLPASGSFPRSRVFTSDDQSIGASASVFPMNIQNWFPLGLIDLLAVQKTLKGLCQHHNLKASILPHSDLK